MPIRRVGTAERRARLGIRHRLASSTRSDDVTAIADSLVALHSTDPVSVYLAATARMDNPSLAAVDEALYEKRALLRHHAMRRTLWVLSHEAARAAHHSVTTTLEKRQRRMLENAIAASSISGDPARWVETATDAIIDLLTESGPLSAREIGDRLPDLAVPIPVGTGRFATTQSAHSRVLLVLGFAGRVLRARPTGTWINGQYRWAAAADWFPDGFGQLDQRSAAADLARLWLRAFGPATSADLQWWTGWTATATKRALADVNAVEVELDDGIGYLLPDDLDPPTDAEPWVALLPALDPSTMGWKQRDWYLDPSDATLLFDRNGNAGPTIWVDGEIVGGWAQRQDGSIALRLLRDIGAERRDELEQAAHALEQLIGEVRFSVRFPAPLQSELLR